MMNELRQFIHILHGIAYGLSLWAIKEILQIPKLAETGWPGALFLIYIFLVVTTVWQVMCLTSYIERHWKDKE